MSNHFAPPKTPPAAPAQKPNLEAELGNLNWQAGHHASIQMRYSDTDAMGHLNNAVYVQYLETSRSLFMREITQTDLWGRSVVARLELDYRREIKLGQNVTVDSLIEQLGRTSWTILSRIVADGQPSAFARTVLVHVDDQLRPAPIQAELRALLIPLTAKSAQE